MKKERQTRTLAGLDLNGLQDFCAREPGHVSGERKEEYCNRLGWRSVAVRIDDEENMGDVIAGPQAERSCYGRGSGYGERIGDRRRRVELRKVWLRIESGKWSEPDEEESRKTCLDGDWSPLRTVEDRPEPHPNVCAEGETTLLRTVDTTRSRGGERGGRVSLTEETVKLTPIRRPGLGEALRAGVVSAAPSAQRAVLIVPDIPSLSESAQQRLLEELARTKLGGCTVDLLWRPVAVTLGALNESQGLRVKKVLESSAGRGKGAIAVLIAGIQGVEIQRLRLRFWKGRLLPERKKNGERLLWKGDWTWRCGALERQLEDANGRDAVELLGWQTRTIEHTVAEGAYVHRTGANAVRDERGRWITVEMENPALYAEQPLPRKAIRLAQEVECVLLYSPGGGVVTRAMKHGLMRDGVPAHKLIALGEETAARGALMAARCLEKGEAPYLDHLPQFDLWITDFDGSKTWYPLIPADEAVEAGKTYRTRVPIQLELVANTGNLILRLRKENEQREHRETLVERPRNDHLVHVVAEQRPVSGYATCKVESESYEPLRQHPIRIVWSDLDGGT